MANSNTPMGLQPVNGAYSQPWSAGVRLYYHAAGDSTPLWIGDLVTQTGDSFFYNQGGINQPLSVVTRSATGDVFTGVVVGVLQVTRDSAIYAPASTGVAVFVCDDPNALFVAQDANSGTPLTANDIGLNINISVVNGSNVTGFSGSVLNNGTEADTNTLDLKIVGQFLDPTLDFGSSVSSGAAANKFLVRINRHRYANQIAGI